MTMFNHDASTTIYFENQLRMVLAQTYDQVYPEFKYSTLLPIATEGLDMSTIEWRGYDYSGRAKITADNSKDIPRVDLTGRFNTARIHELSVAYGYTMKELRLSQRLGVALDSKKGDVAKRAIEREINRIMLFGDANYELQGFINAMDVPTTQAAAGASGHSEWASKTTDEILMDLNIICESIPDFSHGIEEPNTLILPRSRWTRLMTTARTKLGDATIMDFFNKTQPAITQIEWLNELETAGPGGTAMMIAYNKSPSKLVGRLPKPFEQLAPERSQLEYEIICQAQCGGVNVFYPKSMARIYGI